MTGTQLFISAGPASAGLGPRTSQQHGGWRLWAPATVDLTVVIPFFNPGATLRHTVLAVIECLAAADISFEVIAVSDGSTDGSADTVTDIAHTRVISNF